MEFSFRSFMSFFAEFEDALAKNSVGDMDELPRDPLKLLNAFQIYSNCKYSASGADFSDTSGPSFRDYGYNVKDHSRTIISIVFNFGDTANIFVNTERTASGEMRFNNCNRRFFTVKEAFHVILRDEFIRGGSWHPDTASPETLTTSIERMLYLPTSILDLTNKQYPVDVRVEHLAELFAVLLLYPMDFLARDRTTFFRTLGTLAPGSAKSQIISTFGYADSFKIPQRYVDLMFRWHRFSDLHKHYQEARGRLGYG